MSKIWEPSGGVADKVLFGMYPEDLDAQDRQELYAEAFEDIVKSYSTMATACRYQAIINEMIDDATRAQLIADTQAAMEAVSVARTAMDSISQSATAMDSISASDVAMDAVWESQIARDIVLEVSMAAGKFVASLADLHGPDYADIDDVATDQDAMDAVSTSQTAMDAVSVSAIAMEAVAASQIAMDAVVAATDVALPTVVETETAMNEVSLSDLALDTLWASSAAWDLIKANAMAVGKFAVGRAGLSGYDYADIDAVAGSQTAMDAVSTSETAMDAVSASTLAMDAIWDSQLAWDTVAAVSMAVGKFVAGRAGLDGSNYADIDAVASDQTAMDAVAGSQTAMDAVAASITAMNAVMSGLMPRTKSLSSSHVVETIWSSATGSTRVWEEGTPTPPHNFDSFDLKLVGAANGTGDAIAVTNEDDSGVDSSGKRMWGLDLDFDNVGTLTLETQWQTNAGGSDMNMEVRVGGDTLYQVNASDSDFSWTERSFDVSGKSGTQTLELGINFTGSGYSGVFEAFFDEIQLS